MPLGEEGIHLKTLQYVTIFLFLAVAQIGVASAQEITSPYIPDAKPKFTVMRHAPVKIEDAVSASLSGTMIPLWSGSFTSNSTPYPFVMVGTDPSLGASTKIPTVVVPLIFRFHDTTGVHSLSPTRRVCGGTRSALNLTRNSPIFQSFSYSPGGIDVGTTQYVDAFQRANFWNDVSTTSPNYHVLLSKTGQTAGVVINVPAGSGLSEAGPCARIGLVDVDWFDVTIAQPLLLKMTALKPTVFPIFLSYNVFLYQGSTSNCCILGYHSNTVNSKGIQTYAYAAFNDPGIFVDPQNQPLPIEDIDALSHEIGEWMDDPVPNTNLNLTPSWGNIGQVSGCANFLENGDPLTGNALDVTNPINHFTYHPQDLAFVPWFAQGPSSTSVNGWFDFLDLFGSSAAPCP
jgi:hypothetical protein